MSYNTSYANTIKEHPITVQFHKNEAFRIAEAIPVIGSVSASIRLVSAVAFVVFNLFASLFYAISSCFLPSDNDERGEFDTRISKEKALDDCKDALSAAAYNCVMIGDAIITAIPVIGNIQSWVWFVEERQNRVKYEYVS